MKGFDITLLFDNQAEEAFNFYKKVFGTDFTGGGIQRFGDIPAPDGMEAEIARRLALQAAGSMLPFTVIDAATGSVAGMTTYMKMDTVNRRVEIGSTWYATRTDTGLTPTLAGWWLMLFSVPLLQFLFLRWIWRGLRS